MRRIQAFLKTLKILGHEYTIDVKENYVAQSGGNSGQCNNYLNIISIGAELPQSGKNEVLMYEILEAINYRLELGLEHHKLCVLGEVLHQVMRDNEINF
ncbi:hypothetical protein [Sporomusa acidovorans]|uniref:Uncharacterized protein n=1 Tax=Sporomusa acidovorans (strain ATCC 49682 / DSM 3132 / Mol) TaxID=1123286 RepID=A0ABZ3JB42_SPOA4|nr:hypothetical protein [Sporomusa acidovorans]OZC21607.1 hypothetical protein SPACI_16790 [Sporomusa acidovorans DSM 3132]SDD63110.1 hypothetical protein SAMN04488499_1002263 [Sporomusa acidovorans]